MRSITFLISVLLVALSACAGNTPPPKTAQPEQPAQPATRPVEARESEPRKDAPEARPADDAKDTSSKGEEKKPGETPASKGE